jgi:hypothetical protein
MSAKENDKESEEPGYDEDKDQLEKDRNRKQENLINKNQYK